MLARRLRTARFGAAGKTRLFLLSLSVKYFLVSDLISNFSFLSVPSAGPGWAGKGLPGFSRLTNGFFFFSFILYLFPPSAKECAVFRGSCFCSAVSCVSQLLFGRQNAALAHTRADLPCCVSLLYFFPPQDGKGAGLERERESYRIDSAHVASFSLSFVLTKLLCTFASVYGCGGSSTGGSDERERERRVRPSPHSFSLRRAFPPPSPYFLC